MPKPGKIDWLSLEVRVRNALESASTVKPGAGAAKEFAKILLQISDTVGDQTGRGYDLPINFADYF